MTLRSSSFRAAELGLALACLLTATEVRAEPEGYRGGEGRPPGATYTPHDGPSITVRRVVVEAVVVDDRWVCGGVAMPRGTYDLVTVVLELSNPANHPTAGPLANFDLVIGEDKKHVVEGTCARGGQPLGVKRSATVREQFLVQRGDLPKILVYNDDDFPALFALPTAKRLPAKARGLPRPTR